jgi:alkanesulfonate monooxygenase SsuD/methylene tetrahydromethanopterin reductase-like flavin-dependent oxidoreductase (luciferase family)
MKFGLALLVQHRPDESQVARFQEHLQQVRRARDVGFDSIWASQHYLSAPNTYFQPIPTLARVAAESGDMALGTGVLLLPLLSPVDVAEQLATLDVISGGRVIVGVGLGYRDDETRAMGLDPRHRVERLEEGIEVLARLWTGESVTHHGRHFRLDRVRLSMPTVQRPRPPIWLAANLDAGVRRAARLGDAWLMNPHAAIDQLQRQLRLFRAERERMGRSPAAEIPIVKECYVAPDRATAIADARPFLEEKYRAYRQWGQDQTLPPGELWSDDFAELARDRFILGDPAAVREEIHRHRERLGVTTMTLRTQWPGMAQAKVLRSITLLGERVFPHVR